MTFTPNPTTYETMLELKYDQPEFFDVSMEWELEIFDRNPILKEKKTNLKNTRYNIKTSGWKAGIYFVRVNLKGKVKTSVFVVTK